MRPINIRIIKKKGEDYFRLKYMIKGCVITTAGFINNKELAKIIKEDTFFKLDINQESAKR